MYKYFYLQTFITLLDNKLNIKFVGKLGSVDVVEIKKNLWNTKYTRDILQCGLCT